MGFGSFVNMFLWWNIILFSLFTSLIFFESLKSKSTQMLRPQKGNLGVLSNDTLLNFGLCLKQKYIYFVNKNRLWPVVAQWSTYAQHNPKNFINNMVQK